MFPGPPRILAQMEKTNETSVENPSIQAYSGGLAQVGAIEADMEMSPVGRLRALSVAVVKKKQKKKKAQTWKDVLPDDDFEAMLEKGGPGIDQPMELGKNVRGTAMMTIPPMGEGDKPLIQVRRKGHKSYNSSMHHVFTHLMARTGLNETGDYQPARDSTGKKRPIISAELFNYPSDMFCDNMIVVGDGDFQDTVIEGFGVFRLTRGNKDHTKRISVTGVRRIRPLGHVGPLERGEGQRPWKVAAADVPLDTIDLFLRTYLFGLTWDKNLGSITIWAETEFVKPLLADLQISTGALVTFIEHVAEGRFRIIDFDLTKDVPGTLHSEDFKRAVTSAGHKLHAATTCGLSCVKYDVKGHDGVTMKDYNKIAETMQQGTPRKDDISCKFARLLTPSTVGLTTKLCDTAYNENGLTREEATFIFPIGKAWSLEKMVSVLHKSHALLENCLVTTSIQEHISGMEACLTRSMVVYCPLAFNWKLRKQRLLSSKAKGFSDYKTMYPDGAVLRWQNKYTHKVNGQEAHGTITGRPSDIDKSGWDAVAHLAAACCHSGQNPRLFILVGGTERFFDGGDANQTEKPDGPVHFYLREVPLQRFFIAPNTRLQTGFIGEQKHEWEKINVRPHELKLYPRIIHDVRETDLQIDLAIPEAFSSEDLQDVEDASSDAVAAATGKTPGIMTPNEFNMPSVPTLMGAIKSQKSGKKKTDKLKFKHRGAWVWFPKEFEAAIRAKVFEQDRAVCTFHWGDGTFNCTIYEGDEASAITASGANSLIQDAEQHAVTTTFVGKKQAMFLIPVSTEGHAITGAGVYFQKGNNSTCFVQISLNLFNLPASLSVKLLALAEERSTPNDISFLRGCTLIKPDEDRVRSSGFSANEEPHLWIVKATGEILVEQQFTPQYSKKREKLLLARELLRAEKTEADEGAGEGGSATKRQRVV